MITTPPLPAGRPTIRDALRNASSELAAIGAAGEARHLVAGVLGTSAGRLHPLGDAPLDHGDASALGAALARRLAGEPLAYVLGSVEFREITLAVDPRVLIPRPETEYLVDLVVGLPVASDARVLEVGVGSGAIALSLLHEGRFRRVVGTDVSAAALEVARLNASALGLRGRLELRHGRTYAPVAARERFDLVVSNPPYVAAAEREALPPEVREHEPAEALFAGDGLDVIRALIRGAPQILASGGWLALEIGATQGVEVRRALREAGLQDARVVTDLTGRDRIAIARAPVAAVSGSNRNEAEASSHEGEAR
ncbi:MAG TPA: peptide chain release factor N(5)-glutamine methyltransferase [Longimicrobiales bacterium]|nr:peptide chain release factor N(5)-glutamine methyltransferase [Longimicrobiales bacterium]